MSGTKVNPWTAILGLLGTKSTPETPNWPISVPDLIQYYQGACAVHTSAPHLQSASC